LQETSWKRKNAEKECSTHDAHHCKGQPRQYASGENFVLKVMTPYKPIVLSLFWCPTPPPKKL